MNYKSSLLSIILDAATKEQKEVAKLSEDIISGRKKRSEAEILARGGHGISRVTKKRYRKALKRVEKRI